MIRILIAEDDESLRCLLAKALSGPGRVVVTAEDGAAALRSCRDDPPDLVLVDVLMPGLDGPAFRRALASDSRTSGARVVFVSGCDFCPAREARDLFLQKPFGLEDVRSLVDRVLADRAAEEELSAGLAKKALVEDCPGRGRRPGCDSACGVAGSCDARP